MHVFRVGGFLGSGKTTMLLKLAKVYVDKGLKTAIIVNESGEVGVDGATIKAEGYNATELPEGCICCTLVGTLQATLRNIKRDLDPDILIIEPTGLALPHKVKQFVHTAMIDEDSCSIIGLADVERFDILLEKKEEFYKMQMSGADLVLINKVDLAQPGQVDHIRQWFAQNFPGKPVEAVSAKTGENIDKLYDFTLKQQE
ncbi:MAG: GTPase [Candidatus Methanomethylophilaceae archaeon]|nr:GTPase [Candidatus Methanomethylophilaceae archaeon]